MKNALSANKKDVIPYYGLSIHKPSILWPPPGDDHSREVRQGIRHRLREVTGLGDQGRLRTFLSSKGRASVHKETPMTADKVADAARRMDFGASTPAPSVIDGQDQRIALEVENGETLKLDSQIQFYAPNHLLSHPLISHCRAHLGGLPPLFFIAGDQEVLRDEIIYTCGSITVFDLLVVDCILGPTEQRTRRNFRYRQHLNDSIPGLQNSRRNTPLRLKFTSKYTMDVHTSYLSSSRSPPPQNTVSERLQVLVDSSPGCRLPVPDLLRQ